MINPQQIKQLRRTVWSHYRAHARDNLPWRHTYDPYKILVSEIMLQQTQVARVVQKYEDFMKKFPTVQTLAQAPLSEVLIAWQGLGYNRRAKMLHDAAQVIVVRYAGVLPQSDEELRLLPGVGHYTAGAVCAFAYNMPIPIVETNIRTVIFHHLYGARANVSDLELLGVSKMLLEKKRPRQWYWALMDYGAFLKGRGIRINHKSKHYVKQSKFEGSDRQIRGMILRVLADAKVHHENHIQDTTQVSRERLQVQLRKLECEGLIRVSKSRWWVLAP